MYSIIGFFAVTSSQHVLCRAPSVMTKYILWFPVLQLNSMEISTVNFDDLFDFSPEPLDNLDGGQAHPGAVDNSQQKQFQQHQQSATLTPPYTGEDNHHLHSQQPSPHQPHLLQQHQDLFKLSQSVPTNWGGTNFDFHHSGQAEAQVGTGTGTGSSSASSFNASVGQLLDELPVPHKVSPQHTLSESSSATAKGKRGRKPGQRNLKTDMKSKLERSRQSARECRARKKLRYQYLDDLILEREKANILLREELLKYQKWCHELDKGRIPEGFHEFMNEMKREKEASQGR